MIGSNMIRIGQRCAIIAFCICLFIDSMRCHGQVKVVQQQERTGNMTIALRVEDHTFNATLNEGPTADALRAMLPLTVAMQDLNGNEKFHQFDTGLPASDHKPGTVQAGDLMLWSGNTLVLFYKTFKTGYPYTRIGRIEDPEGLAEAVGKGKVVVRFEAL